MINPLTIRWAVKMHPRNGEIYSGDGFIVRETIKAIFIFIIDGLGHGIDAFKSKEIALNYLQFFDFSKFIDFNNLFKDIHVLLHEGRGIVLSAVQISKENLNLDWAAIGNVNGFLMSEIKSFHFVNQDGIVGFNLPEIQVRTVNLTGNEVIILYTDGVKDFFGYGDEISQFFKIYDIDEITSNLFDKYRNDADDALLWIGKIQLEG